MKLYISTLNLSIFLLLGCASHKIIQKSPFYIHSSNYYQHQNRSTIYIRYSTNNFIAFDSIYFQGQKAKIQLKTIRGLNYIFAEFKPKTKDNLVIDLNPTKELYNPVPTLSNFNLAFDEAIISFKLTNRIRYYKVIDVKETKNPRTN